MWGWEWGRQGYQNTPNLNNKPLFQPEREILFLKNIKFHDYICAAGIPKNLLAQYQNFAKFYSLHTHQGLYHSYPNVIWGQR